MISTQRAALLLLARPSSRAANHQLFHRAHFRCSPVVCCAPSEPPPLPPLVATELSSDDLAAADDDEPLAPPQKKGGAIQPGTCYYVGTPIGNLEDITLRAVRTLQEVDIVASEDTRVTSSLLRHLGIEKKRLVSHHDHNLGSSVPKLLELLAGGASVAVVSDAGTPGISDPGLALANACAARGVPLVPVPGPCAAVAALSVAGLSATEFVFAGFLARPGNKARREKVEELSTEARAVVLYEAPHRLLETLGDLSSAGCGDRGILLARELTKLHEELHRGSVHSAYLWYSSVAEKEGRIRGEFTVVLAPLDAAAVAQQKEGLTAEKLEAAVAAASAKLEAGGAISKVSKEVAAEFGVAKKAVYEACLRWKSERRGGR